MKFYPLIIAAAIAAALLFFPLPFAKFGLFACGIAIGVLVRKWI